MRVIAAIAGLGLAGCNLVFGLEPPAGGATDATSDHDDGGGDGGGDGGDGGGDDAAVDVCGPTPVFCARFATGLYDDGFRSQSTVIGGAAIYHVAEAPLFARSQLDDSSLIGEGTIDAELTAVGAEHYVVSFLIRGALACGVGSPNTTAMTLFQFTFPSAITAFVRRTGGNLEIGSGSITGESSSLVPIDLSDRFHRVDIDVDFPGDRVSFTIDGSPQSSFGMPSEPSATEPAKVIVGLKATGNQPDCEMDYDDLVVSIR